MFYLKEYYLILGKEFISPLIKKKIIEMAKASKELGAELFVLDDGWFGERNDDSTSLGDWYPNKDKIGSLKN